MARVVKIMGEADWAAALEAGRAPPAAVDLKDGFIHLSTESQALETARLHFAGRADLVVAIFDSEGFGDALRWEPSRGGALFPHLYGALATSKALAVRRLRPAPGGAFEFGETL